MLSTSLPTQYKRPRGMLVTFGAIMGRFPVVMRPRGMLADGVNTLTLERKVYRCLGGRGGGARKLAWNFGQNVPPFPVYGTHQAISGPRNPSSLPQDALLHPKSSTWAFGIHKSILGPFAFVLLFLCIVGRLWRSYTPTQATSTTPSQLVHSVRIYLPGLYPGSCSSSHGW